jgi:hypothetical protein
MEGPVPAAKFSSVLDKYSRYFRTNGDRRHLLDLGHRLFGGGQSGNDSVSQLPADYGEDRPSYVLLRVKEAELRLPPLDRHVKQPSAAPHPRVARRGDHAGSVPSEQLAEEIMVVQDRNAVLLKRRKFLERARDAKNRKYCQLMEESVQQKVKLRLEVQKLKDELARALARSQPTGGSRASEITPHAVMDELADLNQLILLRVSSFKIALSRDTVAIDRTVMTRYKMQMEKILGHIYEHSESLPSNLVLERFHGLSEETEREIKDVETELGHEHRQNDQLQREATELGNSLAQQMKEVDMLKKDNNKRETAIQMLREVANMEIAAMKLEYQQLLENTSDDQGAMPTSARAMVSTTWKENRKIRRTPSGHVIIRKDSAMPQTRTIEALLAEQHTLLQDKLVQALAY